jgi:hypothetical protein
MSHAHVRMTKLSSNGVDLRILLPVYDKMVIKIERGIHVIDSCTGLYLLV